MLHAAAALTGLWLLWLLLTQRAASPVDIALGAAAAFAAVVIALRLFGPSKAYARAFQFAAWMIARAPDVVRGALGAIRAAIAADVALKPALVRVRSRAEGDATRAAFADMISARAGAIVVESDADGLLVHVLDEDQIDAERLGKFEARVIGAFEGGRET